MPTKSKSTADSKSVVRHVRFTQGLWDRVTQVSQRPEFEGKQNNVLMAAVRQYLTLQEDIIGSRSHFQKTFRERIDELERQQHAEIQEITLTLNAHLAKIYELLAGRQATTSEITSPTSTDNDLMMLELHTILTLLTTGFASIFARSRPELKPEELSTELLHKAITQARHNSKEYEVTLEVTKRVVPTNPFDEKELLDK